MQFGKNEFSEPNWEFVTRFDLFDLFPRLLPGSYDTVMHEGIPLLYGGVLTLFMLPIYFLAKRVSGREKIFYGGFVILYVLLMVINPFDLVMHGFQEPNCLNYRYSFIVIFLLLIMAYKGFCEVGEHSTGRIFGTGGAILALLAIAQKMEFPNFVLKDTEDYKYGFELHKLPFFWVVVFTIIAVGAIGAIVCHLIRTQDKKRMSQILLVAVCIELFVNGIVLFCSMNYDIGWASYSSYSQYFKALTPIVETVQDKDKTFYRSEKTTHRCTNDNMALNIKGLSNSTSTLNQKVIDLLEYLGFYVDAHWTQYIGSTVVTDSLLGIKYIYSNTENETNKESLTQNDFMFDHYELYAEDENYYAFKNPYALGLAFGVENAVKDLEWDLQYDYSMSAGYKNPFEVQNVLLNTLLGNGEDDYIDFFKGIEFDRSNISGTSGTIGGGMEYSASTGSIDDYFLEFNFVVENDGPLYLFLPTGYEKSFTVFIDDEQYVSNSNYSRIVFLGERQEGEEMHLKFRMDDGKLYFYKNTSYIYTLDMEAFERAYSELAKTSLVTTEKSTDSHIFGSITTYESNKTIMTSIPFDKGWRVYVDGKRVDTYAIVGDSLMAFDIANEGSHEIEFVYMPDIYVISGIISALSIAVYVALIVIDRKKAKVASKETNEADEEKTEGEN